MYIDIVEVVIWSVMFLHVLHINKLVKLLSFISDVILYGNLKDLTRQKQSQGKHGYTYSSDTVVLTAKDQTVTALFPHSGKNSAS